MIRLEIVDISRHICKSLLSSSLEPAIFQFRPFAENKQIEQAIEKKECDAERFPRYFVILVALVMSAKFDVYPSSYNKPFFRLVSLKAYFSSVKDTICGGFIYSSKVMV